MSTYVFPGHKPFSDRAVEELGFVGKSAKGKPPAAYVALGHLCAEASTAPESSVAEVLRKAVEFRDQLVVAVHAADLMIAEVTAARTPAIPEIHSRPRRDRS